MGIGDDREVYDRGDRRNKRGTVSRYRKRVAGRRDGNYA